MILPSYIVIIIVNLFATQWKGNPLTSDSPCKSWIMPKQLSAFVTKYDGIQSQLESICGKDELLSGILSKAKGQLLRVAACLHVLFKLETPDTIEVEISDKALSAAIDFIDVCCDHASLITGRGCISDEASKGKCTVILHVSCELLTV